MQRLSELSTFQNEFLLFLELECGYSPLSISAYNCDLQQLFKESDQSQPIEKAIQGYFQVMKTRYKSSTINRKISSLRSFFSYLSDESLVPKSLLAKFPVYKTVEQLPFALSLDEVQRLIQMPFTTESKHSFRDHCILELLYSGGLRVSELTSLKRSDLDIDNKWFKVRGKGNKERHLPLTKKAIVALNLYLNKQCIQDEQYLFSDFRNKALSRQQVFHLIKHYAIEAGIAHASPHVLRHSFATHMIEGGARLYDVQHLLGHKSITSTQVYTSLSNSYLKDVYSACHPRAIS